MRSTFILRTLARGLTRARPVAPVRYKSTMLGLPFKVTRAQANKQLVDNKKFLEEGDVDEQSTAVEASAGDPVKECFLPFHSANVKGVSSDYVGEYGVLKTGVTLVLVKMGDSHVLMPQTYTYTEWYRCGGRTEVADYPFGLKQTQIYAGFDYPRQLVERVIPTADVVHLRPLTADVQVFPHQMNMSYALEKLNARIHAQEVERACEQIAATYGTSSVRVHNLDVRLHEASFNLFSYYLPAYIFVSNVNQLGSYKFINAYTGEMDGNSVLSIMKTSLVGAGVGGVLSLMLTVFTRPYLLPAQLLFRIVIGTTMSGAVSGAFAKAYNHYKDYQFTSERDAEQAEHSKFPESDDDIERRKFSARMNHESDYQEIRTDSRLYRLPVDKCRLLGLNPEEPITAEMVKSAYRKKMLKWHPDMFSEQHAKRQAEAMSQQLNAASEELINILKPKKN